MKGVCERGPWEVWFRAAPREAITETGMKSGGGKLHSFCHLVARLPEEAGGPVCERGRAQPACVRHRPSAQAALLAIRVGGQASRELRSPGPQPPSFPVLFRECSRVLPNHREACCPALSPVRGRTSPQGVHGAWGGQTWGRSWASHCWSLGKNHRATEDRQFPNGMGSLVGKGERWRDPGQVNGPLGASGVSPGDTRAPTCLLHFWKDCGARHPPLQYPREGEGCLMAPVPVPGGICHGCPVSGRLR